MRGLDPGIHDFHAGPKIDVDGRDKPGHDAESAVTMSHGRRYFFF
jgi:hypothetical protein